MKKILLLLSFYSPVASAQTPGEWTWMSGDNFPNPVAVYGTQGVPSTSNKPPGLYEPCQWTDQQGNFWIFGGRSASVTFYSDLWKYNPATSEWTWVKGPGGTLNQPGIYGTMGVSSATNQPGARGWAVGTWTDLNGNLWMFGGYAMDASGGQGDINDLWMYNIGTNEWTWMKGSNAANQSGTYGTKGVPAPANTPGARHESTCTWVDNSGYLWVFGGYGNDSTGSNGFLDDLWKYDVVTGEWTWINGTGIGNAVPNYGLMGVPGLSNTPGGRQSYARWKDNTGNFWMFGGYGIDTANNYGTFNDLWYYDLPTNLWTWIAGTKISNDPGNYGTICIPDPSNLPSSRVENRACWGDTCNNFWMFSGATSVGSYPMKNDLWHYNPSTGNWTWVSGGMGANLPGVYGTLGISSPLNKPGCRMGGVSFTDLSGNLWTFAGTANSGADVYNDMWRYMPDSNCAYNTCVQSQAPMALFTASDTTLCEKNCVDFFDLSTNNPTSWQWTFTSANPSSSTLQNPTNICYNAYGTFQVKLVASNSFGSDSLVIVSYITVFQNPPNPTITQNGDTLTSSSASSYQWYYNNIPVSGATNQAYIALQAGSYYVIITDSNGCSAASAQIFVGVEENNFFHSFIVMPNPGNGLFMLSFETVSVGDVRIEIVNALGEKIYAGEIKNAGGKLQREIDLRNYADGIYLLRLSYGNHSASEKLVLKK